MSASSPAYLAGRMLVAMPGIADPRFHRAVIVLCAHDAREAMGLVVNKPMDGLTVPGLLKQLEVDAGDAPDVPVLAGGPVEPERGFVLHSDEHGAAASSVRFGNGLALTATREILESLAGRKARPRRAMMAVGYAGWQAGQLEREIRESVWLICETDETLLFGADHGRKWTRALAQLGVSAERLSGQPGRA
jgi:putative transcriptional regulator